MVRCSERCRLKVSSKAYDVDSDTAPAPTSAANTSMTAAIAPATGPNVTAIAWLNQPESL
jgi:hypothetical protein